uniref:Lysophosphatidylglycerol acyltransferase 1 n=1 Tax=Oryzias latipes TaxID=8090 RepID=A0A3P9J6Y3_ORYLA
MAQLLDGASKLGWVLLKAVLRFVFMFFNNCVAIPSYCLYLLLLQPLRIWDSYTFWHIEGVMFKWLLGMVSSWGWIAGYTVTEWGDDVRPISEEAAMVIVNHQSTGDVCTLMMCLQDKGTVVQKMMWLMDHVFKYTNFGLVSLIHGDFFIRQGKAHRDKQLVYLKDHLDKYYYNRDRKWIVLFPEGGFLRKRRETSQLFAKKHSLPHLTHVTLPRLGATHVILKTLSAQQENGSLGCETKTTNQTANKHKGLQWVIDVTIAYPKARPMDIQTWIFGYRPPTVTHVHYRILSSSRRTEGGAFPADDPGSRVAVQHPDLRFRLWLHVVQRPPVPLLLFILSALMGQTLLLDHWGGLGMSWCVAQLPFPPTMTECTFAAAERLVRKRLNNKKQQKWKKPIRSRFNLRHRKRSCPSLLPFPRLHMLIHVHTDIHTLEEILGTGLDSSRCFSCRTSTEEGAQTDMCGGNKKK